MQREHKEEEEEEEEEEDEEEGGVCGNSRMDWFVESEDGGGVNTCRMKHPHDCESGSNSACITAATTTTEVNTTTSTSNTNYTHEDWNSWNLEDEFVI